MKALSFGSLNLDYTYRVEHFVRPGETIMASSRSLACGGKGLNQSIALAHAGVQVYHAGAIGAIDGQILKDTLQQNGVNTDHIQILEIGSGSAFIQVDQKGENCIVIDGGANQAITHEMIDTVLADFSAGDWLILQNEISSLPYLITQAKAKGLITVLNPSPFNERISQLPLDLIDYFLINEDEASQLGETAEADMDALIRKYPQAKILITLGSAGCIFFNGNEVLQQSACKVQAVDTTAAGDTFTGFFIGSLMSGKSDAEALETASKAAAISVTRPGASTSIPSLAEVQSFQ